MLVVAMEPAFTRNLLSQTARSSRYCPCLVTVKMMMRPWVLKVLTVAMRTRRDVVLVPGVDRKRWTRHQGHARCDGNVFSYHHNFLLSFNARLPALLFNHMNGKCSCMSVASQFTRREGRSKIFDLEHFVSCVLCATMFYLQFRRLRLKMCASPATRTRRKYEPHHRSHRTGADKKRRR